MFIQHHFSKRYMNANSPSFFFSFLNLLLALSQREVFLPSLEANNPGPQQQEVGSTTQAAPPPPTQSCRCHRAPRVPSGQPREGLDRIHRRMLNFISFPCWFQGAKQGSSSQREVPLPGVAQLRTNPSSQLTKSRADAAAKVSQRV